MSQTKQDVSEAHAVLIFNQHPEMPLSDQAKQFYADDPVVKLEACLHRNRHPRQQRLQTVPLQADPDSPFGSSLDWSYRFYKLSLPEATSTGADQSTDQAASASEVVLGARPSRAVSREQWQMERANRRFAPDSTNDQAANAKPNLCLFNVVVALEWKPSERYLRQLEWAFRKASDFLYDVTDGYMAFGQVVFVGPNFLDCADIQIAASNRYLPRSVVSGLRDEHKYRPIRVGRGCWQKNRRVTLPWDAPESYRTLVHEWAHYALGLKDLYMLPQEVRLGGANVKLAVPGISLPIDSIMNTLEGTSELTPKIVEGDTPEKRQRMLTERKNALLMVDEWEALRSHFSELGIPEGHQPQEGPRRFPLPLPYFRREQNLASESVRVRFENDGYIDATGQRQAFQHCWVFVLTGKGAEERLIPQGSPEQHGEREYLELLGAQLNDTVLVIGEAEAGAASNLVALRGVFNGQRTITSSALGDVTPSSVFADVVPGSVLPHRLLSAEISVHVDAPQVQLFPLEGHAMATRSGQKHAIPSLDGHVLMRWAEGESSTEKLLICNYSQGGSPPDSGFPVLPNPVTAGSSDGNALLFFWDETLFNPSNTRSDAGEPDQTGLDNNDLRIVTTRLHGSPGGTTVRTLGCSTQQGQPRSYVFSIATNQPFNLELLPTLVMFFDKDAKNNLISNTRLAICRYDQAGWQEIETAPQADPYMLAIPLNKDTAPQLTVPRADLSFVERYRVFALPA